MDKPEFEAARQVSGDDEAYRRAVVAAKQKAARELEEEHQEEERRRRSRIAWCLLMSWAILATTVAVVTSLWAWNSYMRIDAERTRCDKMRQYLIQHKVDPEPNWREHWKDN